MRQAQLQELVKKIYLKTIPSHRHKFSEMIEVGRTLKTCDFIPSFYSQALWQGAETWPQLKSWLQSFKTLFRKPLWQIVF